MVTNKNITSFDDITEDNRLWAVRYEGDEDNILDILFAQWDDVQWLRSFLRKICQTCNDTSISQMLM